MKIALGPFLKHTHADKDFFSLLSLLFFHLWEIVLWSQKATDGL